MADSSTPISAAAKKAATSKAKRLATKKTSAGIQEGFVGDRLKTEQANLTNLQGQLGSKQTALQEAKDAQEAYMTQSQEQGGQFDEDAAKKFQTDIRDAEKSLSSLQSQIGASQSNIDDPTRMVSAREKDIVKGAQFGESVLGEDGLGRLSEDVDIQETLGRFKDISEQGLSREEVAAERERMSEGVNRSTQTASRRMQALLAKSGVRGASAGRQLMDIEVAGAAERASGERDLFLRSEQLKREGLKDFSSRLGEMKTFDLGQSAAEKNIILSSGMGFAQMGVSERTAKVQAKAQEAAARARASANRGGCFREDVKVIMENGETKEIYKLTIGDKLSAGKVIGLSVHDHDGRFINIDGVMVTKGHALFDPYMNKWVLSQNCERGIETYSPHTMVYNLFTDTGIVTLVGSKGTQLYADYEGPIDLDKANEYNLGEMNEALQDVSEKRNIKER